MHNSDTTFLSKLVIVTVTFTFLLSCGFFWLLKPRWVEILDENTGKYILTWKHIFSYSLTVSFIVTICMLLFQSKSVGQKVTYSVSGDFISPEVAESYKSRE